MRYLIIAPYETLNNSIWRKGRAIKSIVLQTICLFLMTGIITGCKKNNGTATPDKGNMLDTSVKTILVADIRPSVSTNNQFSVLGYGYDVTGMYADMISVRNPVIDSKKFEKENPNYISNMIIRSQDYVPMPDKTVNALELLQDFSYKIDKTNKLALFKASLGYPFKDFNPFNQQSFYRKSTTLIKNRLIRMYSSTEKMTDYLTDSFKTALQTMSPDQLVRTYGTHVLTAIYTGAKFEVIEQSTGKNLPSSRRVFYYTRGCDSSKAMYSMLSLGRDAKSPLVNISDWQSTFTDGNTVLIDFGEQGLIPLSDLITDVSKKSAVKEYINTYLQDNQVKLD